VTLGPISAAYRREVARSYNMDGRAKERARRKRKRKLELEKSIDDAMLLRWIVRHNAVIARPGGRWVTVAAWGVGYTAPTLRKAILLARAQTRKR
jgi:hypothetical protein